MGQMSVGGGSVAREETGSPQTCLQSRGRWVRPKSPGELWRLLPWWEWGPGLMAGSCTGLGAHPSLFLSHRRSCSRPPPRPEPQRGGLEGWQGLDDKDRSHLGTRLWVVRAGGAELGAGKQPALCVRELGCSEGGSPAPLTPCPCGSLGAELGGELDLWGSCCSWAALGQGVNS